MKILAVGDVMLGDQPFCAGFGLRSKAIQKGYAYLFEKIAPVFSSADIVTGNLECVIASLPETQEETLTNFSMRAPDDAADALANGGINLITVANNHIFEHGPDAFQQTLENLNRVGIAHVGSKQQPYIIHEMGEEKIAFLGWSMLPDTYWPELNPVDYYNITTSIEPIIQEVQGLLGKADRIVLHLHWGNEFIDLPSIEQKRNADALLEAGVDLIIGHHSHVLQPIETRPKGIVSFSLGNFIFDYWLHSCRKTAAMVYDTSLNTVDSIPIWIDDDHIPEALPKDHDLYDEIQQTLEQTEALERGRYVARLATARQWYRKEALKHFIFHLHRFGFKRAWQMGVWGLKRIIFIFSIRHQEKKDPDIVYTGPMK